MKDLQKANMWKRISAALLDFILITIVAVGMALLLSTVLGYDRHAENINAYTDEYESTYGVDFELPDEELEKLTEAEKDNFNTAWKALMNDERVIQTYNIMLNLALLIVTFGLLLAFVIMELAIPLVLGNGQTIGKKIFGIAVIREDGIRLPPVLLFVRTVLGKYTVETMLPVFILIMLVFGAMGIIGLAAIAGLLILQLVLLIVTPARTPLHDKLAHTVTVDLASQRIFNSPEEREDYYKRLHDAERGEDAAYR